MEENTFYAPQDSLKYAKSFDAAFLGDAKRLAAAFSPTLNVNAFAGDSFNGPTALHIASIKGNVKAIQFLIAHGADVDIRDTNYSTPLREAATFAHAKAVEVLLDHGADLNLRNEEYGTALHHVLREKANVSRQQIETIELFLDRGQDVNAPGDGWGSTVVSRHRTYGLSNISPNFIDFIDPPSRINGKPRTHTNPP